MQIQLNQNDIETAVRNYVSAMGITRSVDEIQFSVSRKGGQSIEAEIDLADCTGGARPSTPSGPDSTPGPRKAPEPVAEPEPVEEPEPVKDEAPFTPDQDAEPANEVAEDTVEDGTAEEPAKGKSLFG